MKNEWGLTGPQEKFAQGVADGKSQAQAYREAYPRSKAWGSQSVIVNASKLSADANVSLRVAMLAKKSADDAELDRAEFLRELRRVALSDPAKIIGPEGQVLLPNELDAATRAAVASFEIDDMGRVRYKFWNKVDALKAGMQHMGLFQKDNEQKLNPLMNLLMTLNGNVVVPVAAPEGGAGKGSTVWPQGGHWSGSGG